MKLSDTWFFRWIALFTIFIAKLFLCAKTSKYTRNIKYFNYYTIFQSRKLCQTIKYSISKEADYSNYLETETGRAQTKYTISISFITWESHRFVDDTHTIALDMFVIRPHQTSNSRRWILKNHFEMRWFGITIGNAFLNGSAGRWKCNVSLSILVLFKYTIIRQISRTDEILDVGCWSLEWYWHFGFKCCSKCWQIVTCNRYKWGIFRPKSQQTNCINNNIKGC